MGISILKDIKHLQLGLEKAFEFGYELLIEQYIKGREFTVGILNDTALPIIEIKTAAEFFNYEAKYKDDRTQYLIVEKIFDNEQTLSDNIPRSSSFLTHSLYKKVQTLALNAHKILGCRGFSRVDILMDAHNNFYLLEVNTIPGFTEKSLLPKAAKADGISFTALCEKIVDLAFQNILVSADESTAN